MTVTVAPARTMTQKLEALQLANEVRFARARLKDQIRRGHIDACDILRDPPDYAATMRVAVLLAAQPGWGPSKTNRAMIRTQIAWAKTLGGLTEMRRRMLLDYLEKRR